MFIAMNRFRIAKSREEDFIAVWRQRESHLESVPGFREFHLLQEYAPKHRAPVRH